MEAIDAARQGIRASLKEINKKNQTFSNQLSALPTQEREYIEMKRQQKIKETVYLFLMQKLQEKELVNSPDEQAEVIDAAYCSALPIYPRKLDCTGHSSCCNIHYFIYYYQPSEYLFSLKQNE